MINVIWTFTPDAVMLLSFALFTKVVGQELTVPTAFTSLALFALIRAPMNMLPASVTQLLQSESMPFFPFSDEHRELNRLQQLTSAFSA